MVALLTDRGHVALVTGASGGGIGRAIALELAAQGIRVVLASRSVAGMEESASAIAEAGGMARIEPLDLVDRTSIESMLNRLRSDGWPVDILVNNAADLSLGDALACSDDTWDRVLAVNLTGPFILARELARSMTRLGWGRIVNVSSVAGQKAMPRCAAYGVSKAGLDHLTRILALELATSNVTVNAVSLGPIATDSMESAHTSHSRNWLLSQVPARRMGDPAGVARIVAVLVSPESDYITGQVWALDGGISVT